MPAAAAPARILKCDMPAAGGLPEFRSKGADGMLMPMMVFRKSGEIAGLRESFTEFRNHIVGVYLPQAFGFLAGSSFEIPFLDFYLQVAAGVHGDLRKMAVRFWGRCERRKRKSQRLQKGC